MSKNYLFTFLLICFFALGSFAQETRQQPNPAIDGLSFYPNPVSNGKIYITSKSTLDIEILIFDVLGKKVMQTILTTKELNISNLSPGVYIIKIKEGETTATRKLIVK